VRSRISIRDGWHSIASIDAPANNASFGIGEQTCDAGAGNYGIRVQATVDQEINREATIFVNGVIAASDVPIMGTSLDACVAVPDNMENTPDGPSTITLRLDSIVGMGSDSDSVVVNVDTLELTDPVASQLILSADDCDAGPGFGYPVEVALDVSQNGAAYTLSGSGGAGALTGTVSGGAISRCLPLVPGGARTITVSLDGTGISQAVNVTVLDDTPVILSIDEPLDNASIGIGGQTCDAGAGNYGVRVQATETMSALLAGIAGVSLLVGGIGIMNIMLVSVTERTREIGLQLAVGARGRDVLRQFALEALLISLAGGAVGVVVGLVGSQVIARTLGWAMSVSSDAVVMSVAFAALVGLLFGYYPARKAAALEPIDALRYE